jgi:hypothetical protein
LENKEKNKERQGKLSAKNHPSECTLKWTKNGTCGIHNFLFSQFLMQVCDVLGMQISPFECRKQEEYLNPILISFQIMTNVPI